MRLILIYLMLIILPLVSAEAQTIQLNTAQVNEINNRFSEIHEFELGRQRDRPVDCLGILYIEVLKGALVSTRNVNFGFN